jgi:hypothetical protein
MLKFALAVASLLFTPVAIAQAQTPPPGAMALGAACPAGTSYAAIRHNRIKPGQWTVFEKAVAAHNGWYADHKNATTTTLVRTLAPRPTGPVLSTEDAVTITRYAPVPQPEHDAAYEAFTAQYKASADMADEARVCLPAMR